jgi:tartrate dehydrogenase/decarboxylase / D-malate dehydrogenase
MLGHLGLPGQAVRLRKAVDATTGSGVLTRDVGSATTGQVVAAIISSLAR